jgi:hypothetical protein
MLIGLQKWEEESKSNTAKQCESNFAYDFPVGILNRSEL